LQVKSSGEVLMTAYNNGRASNTEAGKVADISSAAFRRALDERDA